MIEFQALSSGSHGNAYIVTDGETPLLLECGISMSELRKRSGFGLGKIQGCLLSHEHKDHCKSIKDVMKAGIDLYTSQGTAQALGVDGHRLHTVQAKKQVEIGSWKVMPFDTIHDCQEPLGFLLTNQVNEKLLFATDTHYIPYKFQGLTHVCIECNFDTEILKDNVDNGIVHPQVAKKLWSRHMSLNTLVRFLDAQDLARVQEIHVLHLSSYNVDEDIVKSTIEKQTGIPVTLEVL